MSKHGWSAWTVLLSRSRSLGASNRSVGAVIDSTAKYWKLTPAAEQICRFQLIRGLSRFRPRVFSIKSRLRSCFSAKS
jgi:hypothetical protein